MDRNDLPNPTDANAVRAWLDTHRPNLGAVRRWARHITTTAGFHPGPVPPLGGPQWRTLADSDPRKLASALLAALTALEDNTPTAISKRLWKEQRDQDRAVAERLKAASVDLSQADWKSVANRPNHEELEIRRATPGPVLTFEPHVAREWTRTGTTQTKRNAA